MDFQYILYLGSLVTLVLTMAIIFFVVVYQRKILKKNKAIQVVEETLRSKELESVYSIIEAQEEERQRIAKDLHDNVGSVLATLKMYADTLPSRSSQEQSSMLSEIARIAEQAGVETRRLSHSLNDGVAGEFDFSSSLQSFVDMINGLDTVRITAQGDVEGVPDSERGVQLFRIIQELISNTIKHAKATSVRLDFTRVDGTISMIYEDNGRGFDTTKAASGIGIANIRARLEKVFGEMEFESEPGKGSTFIIDIPMV